jgi:hypothetical protein
MTPAEWRKRAAERFDEHGLNPDYSLALELLVFGEDGMPEDTGIGPEPEACVEAQLHDLTDDNAEETGQ